MNITPLDITQKQFRKVFRGLDPEEVEAFLGLVAVEFEALVKDVRRAAGGQPAQGGGDRRVPRARARAPGDARHRAEGVRGDPRLRAQGGGDHHLRRRAPGGEDRAGRAHGRFLRIVDDINELKRQRIQFETNVRTLVESHVKLLDAFREPAREEAVQYIPMKKRTADE